MKKKGLDFLLFEERKVDCDQLSVILVMHILVLCSLSVVALSLTKSSVFLMVDKMLSNMFPKFLFLRCKAEKDIILTIS